MSNSFAQFIAPQNFSKVLSDSAKKSEKKDDTAKVVENFNKVCPGFAR